MTKIYVMLGGSATEQEEKALGVSYYGVVSNDHRVLGQFHLMHDTPVVFTNILSNQEIDAVCDLAKQFNSTVSIIGIQPLAKDSREMFVRDMLLLGCSDAKFIAD